MSNLSPERVAQAAALLRSRISRGALNQLLTRELRRQRFTMPKRLDAIAAEKPQRWAAQWRSTNPNVWEPARLERLDGALDGRRFVVKDSFSVAGASSSSGGLVAYELATTDAALVSRVKGAGGLLVAKVQMTELGVGGLGVQTHYGTLDNPHALGYLPGGSSCGTAVAIANGSADLGIGTDALGSVRIPAAFCGLVGLKPTHGALPLGGYDTVAPSLDCPGPLARTAEECAALWRVMGDSGRPVWGLTARAPTKVGIVREYSRIPVWQPILDAQARILKRLGCEQVEVSIPSALAATTTGTICGSRELADMVGVKGWDQRYAGPLARLVTRMGQSVGVNLYREALEKRLHIRQEVLAALDGEDGGTGVDVLAMPTTAIPAPALTLNLASGGVNTDALNAAGAFTPLASVTGLPSISVPIGEGPQGRPLAIMLVARPGGEERLLSAAAAIELAR